MRYLLLFVFLLSIPIYASKCDKCSEPEWLGICGQVQEHVAGQLDIKIEVVQKRTGWVRFVMYCTNKKLDTVYGYAKYVDEEWRLVTFGTAIDEDFMNKAKIPKEIR